MVYNGPLIGSEGCSILQVVDVISGPSHIESLTKNLRNIARLLGIPAATYKQIFKEREKLSDIPPEETLTEILTEWFQFNTADKCYLITFVRALEKTGCHNMADLLRRKYELHSDALTDFKNTPDISVTDDLDLITNLNMSQESQHDRVASDDNSNIPMLPEDNLANTAGPKKINKQFRWTLGFIIMQLIANVILVIVMFIMYTNNGTTEITCLVKYEHSIWLNVTSFQEYQSISTPTPPNQGVKLSIKMHSLHDWPPESVLISTCNIVELHLSGNVDDFILISLLRQLPSIRIITINMSDCHDSSKVYFNTQTTEELALPSLQKVRKNCVKPKVIIPNNAKYLKLTVSSYEGYEKEINGLPRHLLIELTMNISTSTAWPIGLKDESMNQVKKLIMIGPFSKESLLSVLRHAKEIEELELIDSEAGLCTNLAKWDYRFEQPDFSYDTELGNLEILRFENFGECINIYELFCIHIRTEKLKSLRLKNCMVTHSNVHFIHSFLKVNSQSLEELHFNLSSWAGPFFKHLNTRFTKVSDIEIEFVNHENLSNFLNGLLCDDLFPVLTKLVFINGYFPYDDINIVLTCNKLEILKLTVNIPKGMEPLRMNIFKSVLRLPSNLTLHLLFDGKSPLDSCEVESITGINILTNCALKEVNM